MYYEHYVTEMYLVDEDIRYELVQNVKAVNQGVFSPKMVTLPDKNSNFYLEDQIIDGRYPNNDREILVSSEFLLTRFHGYSLDQSFNVGIDLDINRLSNFLQQEIYICGETQITEGSEIASLSQIQNNCYQYEIVGVINSFYGGINYSGHIFTTELGFTNYVDYLKNEGNFTRADEYYDSSVAFYVKDINKEIDIDALSDELDADVSNPQLREYYETRSLEDMLYYIYLAIFFSLIIISGTIDINIVASSVVSRIREIGIYSCIGVSKTSIRNMFVFETLEIALRIFIINSIIFGAIAYGFKLLYKNIVVDLTNYESIFGVNEMFTYQITFSGLVILSAVAFLFVSVLVPSFRAANMRAIDALRSE
jgi:ABC-type antimicrobial peptide transport system permease subunit